MHQVMNPIEKAIMEWLQECFFEGTFGGTPRCYLSNHEESYQCNILDDSLFLKLSNTIEVNEKTISFSEDDIESILDIQYGTKRAHSALALLYASSQFYL